MVGHGFSLALGIGGTLALVQCRMAGETACPTTHMPMTNPSPDLLHEAVHQALLAGDFDSVRQLSVTLGQAIIRQAYTLDRGDQAAYVRQSLNRLQEHLSFARVLRAHLASQAQANTAVFLYHQASDRAGNSWRFDG